MFKQIIDRIEMWGQQPVRLEVFQEGDHAYIRVGYKMRKPKAKKGMFDGWRSRTILDMIGIG